MAPCTARHNTRQSTDGGSARGTRLALPVPVCSSGSDVTSTMATRSFRGRTAAFDFWIAGMMGTCS
jgi:hypothetical protein